MDIEQLKLILEMVGTAGDGAKDLALIWFGLQFVKVIFSGATVLAIFFICSIKVSKLIIQANMFSGSVSSILGRSVWSESEQMLKEIRSLRS